MTFEQWFDSLEGGYESYKDLLQEAYEAGAEEESKKKLEEQYDH